METLDTPFLRVEWSCTAREPLAMAVKPGN